MSHAIGAASGEFHPAWMLAHFDRIPARGREAAISALGYREPTYPVTVRTLRLAEKWQNAELNSALRSLLADSNPFQSWLLMNESNPDNHYGYHALEMFISQVKASQYGEIERISDTLPPGKLKRQLGLIVVFGDVLGVGIPLHEDECSLIGGLVHFSEKNSSVCGGRVSIRRSRLKSHETLSRCQWEEKERFLMLHSFTSHWLGGQGRQECGCQTPPSLSSGGKCSDAHSSHLPGIQASTRLFPPGAATD